jgi:hypothetical protein
MRLVKREGERERENHFCPRANSLFCWIQWLQPQMPRKAWAPANCVRVREAFRGPESTGSVRLDAVSPIPGSAMWVRARITRGGLADDRQRVFHDAAQSDATTRSKCTVLCAVWRSVLVTDNLRLSPLKKRVDGSFTTGHHTRWRCRHRIPVVFGLDRNNASHQSEGGLDPASKRSE